MMRRPFVLIWPLCVAGATLAASPASSAPDLPAAILDDPKFADLRANASQYRLQIALGIVNEFGGSPVLVHHTYRAGVE